jgi:hypothetical protein
MEITLANEENKFRTGSGRSGLKQIVAENNNADLVGVMYRHIKFRWYQSANTDRVCYEGYFHYHLVDKPPFDGYATKQQAIWNHDYFIHSTPE